MGSQAVNTRSSSSATGTNSLIWGPLFAVRSRRRMVPIGDRARIGRPLPRRTFSTPAMNVVDTAPSPTSITPSFPLAGAMSRPASTTTITVLSEIVARAHGPGAFRSEEHTSELQSQSNLVCRLLLEKKKKNATLYGPQSTLIYYTQRLIHTLLYETHMSITDHDVIYHAMKSHKQHQLSEVLLRCVAL